MQIMVKNVKNDQTMNRHLDSFSIFCFFLLEGILFSSLFTVFQLSNNGILPNEIAYGITILILLVISMHWFVASTDPGVVPSKKCLPPSYQRYHPRYCRVCRICKTPSVHHCSRCQACIREFDHHCPWINNCVGLLNRKPFIVFLIYTFVLCFFASTLCGFLSSSFKIPLPIYGIMMTEFRAYFLSLSLGLTASLLLLLILEQLILISLELTKFETIREKIPLFLVPIRFIHKDPLEECLGRYPWEWFIPF
jgi:palmitoyltransferase